MDSCCLTLIQIVNYHAVATFRMTQRQLEIEKRPHQVLAGPLLVSIIRIMVVLILPN